MLITTIGQSLLYNDTFDFLDLLQKNECNYIRYNLSKCRNNEDFLAKEKIVLDIKNKYKEKLKLMIDIPYPGMKIRIDLDKKSMNICCEKTYLLCSEYNYNDKNIIYTNFNHIGKFLKTNDEFIYSDGLGCFHVEKIIDDNRVVIKANNEFEMFNNKSLSVKNLVLKTIYKTKIFELLQKIEPDSVACSFVSFPMQVKELTDFLPSTQIISKIETAKGVLNVSEISKESNIMIARGDLMIHTNPVDLYENQLIIANATKK